MKFDMYSLKGRVLPAIFSIILPVIIFNHFYVSEQFSKFVGEVMVSKLVSNITISTILLYFLSEMGRLFGKNIFEKLYFDEEKHMPTTNFLIFSNSQYSVSHKIKIRNKIQDDFGVALATKDEERDNEDESRKRIVEAMSYIRSKLHENKFLLQHNIEYGAMRNVIGGSILGSIFSIFNLVFFTYFNKVNLAAQISVVTLAVYLLFILLSKVIINFYGRNYAKILYREYLTTNS